MSTATRLAKLAEGLDSNGVLSAEKGGTGTTSGGAATVVAATAPVSPQTGSFWLNSDTGDLHVYAGGSWILCGGGGGDSLPTQTSNSGKFLTTDGTTASWGTISTTPADGSITAAKLGLGTGYIPIPVGTQAQRPGTPSPGYTRINSDTGYVEVYYNSIWNNTTINFSVGQTATNPGTSAAQIKALTGTTTDGFYWINLPTVGPTQVYCDMNTSGGGWMLAAKVYSDTSKFNGYSSTDWTTVGTFNAAQTPTFTGHIKTDVYNYWVPTTGQRLCAGALTNNLYESWTGYTMVALLNATSQNSQNSRAQWLAWCAAAPGGTAASSFDNQPNCNQAGTNKNYSGFSARIGISMNNEGDCSSNDSCLGFGGTFGPCGWTTWNPTTTGQMVGWIWVK